MNWLICGHIKYAQMRIWFGMRFDYNVESYSQMAHQDRFDFPTHTKNVFHAELCEWYDFRYNEKIIRSRILSKAEPTIESWQRWKEAFRDWKVILSCYVSLFPFFYFAISMLLSVFTKRTSSLCKNVKEQEVKKNSWETNVCYIILIHSPTQKYALNLRSKICDKKCYRSLLH